MESTLAGLYENLEEKGVIYPEIGRATLDDVLGKHATIHGHTLHKGVRITEQGAYRYQEVAVLTHEVMVLWMVNEVSDDPEAVAASELGAAVESVLRVVPLRNISEVNQRIAYSADGSAAGVSVTVILKSTDSLEGHTDNEEPGKLHTHVFPDTLHFGCNREDGDGDVDEVIAFGRHIARRLG